VQTPAAPGELGRKRVLVGALKKAFDVFLVVERKKTKQMLEDRMSFTILLDVI